ncbi:HAMP domain-containing protein [Aneurinibacillus sp. BA2021]|nr:HAMP domain-containing protein [Aneurinibacillus sp. BA2021]
MKILQKWNRMSIRLKFFSVFFAVMLLAGSGMLVLNNQLLQVVRDSDKIITRSVPNSTIQLQLKSTIMERINYVMLYVSTGREEFLVKFEGASAHAHRIEEQLLQSALPHEKDGMKRFINHSRDWEDILYNEVIPVYQRDNRKDALETLNVRAQPIAIQLMNEVEDLSQRKLKEISHDNAKILQDAWASAKAGYMVMGATLLAALLFSYYMARSITNPIFSLLGSVRRMEKGDFSSKVTLTSEDEWGELSNAFNRMSMNTNNLVEELRETNVRLQEESRRAQESTRLKSEFLANMSHELRTPLTGIIGFAELLHEDVEKQLSPAQKKFTNNITKAGEHLLSMINDILDLSKIEAGKYELEMTKFDMVALLRTTLTMLEGKAEQRGISFVFTTAYSVLPVVADKTRIRQVILNLADNAIKFSPVHSTVDVTVEQGRNAVLVHVKDKGIGIEADKTALIFEPFYQNDGRLERKYEGTGLGLALSKQLMELHGGTIKVASKLGEGSVFSIELPVCVEETLACGPCADMSGSNPLLVLYMVDFLEYFTKFSEPLQKEQRSLAVFMIESKLEAMDIVQKHAGYDILVAAYSFQPEYVELLEIIREHTRQKVYAYIEQPLRFVERGQVMRVVDHIFPSLQHGEELSHTHEERLLNEQRGM